ncbi:MAG: peptidylprolyl isomerase [Verrucomicrobiales bacterium]
MKSPLGIGVLTALLALPARADRVFVFNTHTYVVVQTKRTWDLAHAHAVSVLHGSLAQIDDAAENAAILLGASGQGGSSTAADGGGAVYLWIGGDEFEIEGTFGWIDAAGGRTKFWTGGKNGSAFSGLYHNWGRSVVGTAGPEPDNFNGTQNQVGYALGPWPAAGADKIGQPGQWNDLYGTNQLFSIAEVPAPPSNPSGPTNVQVTALENGALDISWQDNALNETSYQIYVNDNPQDVFFQVGSNLVPNDTSLNLSGGQPHTTYEFMIRVLLAGGAFADSAIVAVTVPDWINSRAFHPATVGQPFSYQITTTSAAPASSFGASGLPAGLQVDPASGQVSGTPTQAGVFQATLSAVLADSTVLTAPLTLRVIHPAGPPVVTMLLPTQTLLASEGLAAANLLQYFTDPDTEAAVRFQTSKGSYDVALHQSATPLTVANFLKYVDGTTIAGGNYTNSIIHRVESNFVVQGGGFKPASPNLLGIPTDPSPLNEPGISNVRGTIAMAKLGNDPNSATSQWFVSLDDNSQNLDNQNGGFTAFGRVLGQGMTVMDVIHALPRGTYNIAVDYPPPRGTQTGTFTNWPMDTAPPAPPAFDQTKLVLVQSVTRIQPLVFSISPAGGPEIVTVTLADEQLRLAPIGAVFGNATFSVMATDREGQSVSQPLAVTVEDDYPFWAARRNLGTGDDALPGSDPDGDGLVNLAEFVLAGDPMVSDLANVPLLVGFTETASGPTLTLTFTFRKFLAGLRVQVETSDSLAAGSWNPIWTDSDGLISPSVISSEDLGDRVGITVGAIAATAPAFLRLNIQMLP